MKISKKEIENLLIQFDFQKLICAPINAPLDEYHHEAELIFKNISENDSIEDIMKKTYDVFFSQFCICHDEKGNKFILENPENYIGTAELYREFSEKVKNLYI